MKVLLKNNKKRLAFTLAEVLIVVGIIGVVASITIPSLIHNYQKQKTQVSLKKALSVLSQAILSMATDNGGSIKGIYLTESDFRDILAKYIKATKTCSGNPTQVTGCWAYPEQTYIGTNHYDVLNNAYRGYMVFNDGMSLKVENIFTNCDSPTSGSWSPNYPVCARLEVDINGLRPPNQNSRDIFSFWVTETAVKPGGSPTEVGFLDDCIPPHITDGISCTLKTLLGQDY